MKIFSSSSPANQQSAAPSVDGQMTEIAAAIATFASVLILLGVPKILSLCLLAPVVYGTWNHRNEPTVIIDAYELVKGKIALLINKALTILSQQTRSVL